MASKAAAKPRAKKGANGYLKPKPIPVGDILVDSIKKRFKVGPVIGSGGFGAIYSACNADTKMNVADYPYVIKIVSGIVFEVKKHNISINYNCRNLMTMDHYL